MASAKPAPTYAKKYANIESIKEPPTIKGRSAVLFFVLRQPSAAVRAKLGPVEAEHMPAAVFVPPFKQYPSGPIIARTEHQPI